MQLDWSTLAIQTINVLILVWILARFFFRPVADMVARRQAAAKALLDDAEADRAAAQAARTEAQTALAAVAADRERLMDEARAAADAAKADLLAQADREAAKRRQDVEAAIARDRAAADTAILASASDLSVDIAARLLGRLPASAAQSAFVEALNEALKAHAPGVAPTGEVEVVSAAPLSKAQADRVRAAVAQAFGADAVCRFRTDAGLIAGVELHAPDLVVHNSWRADLNAMRKELGGDRHARQA